MSYTSSISFPNMFNVASSTVNVLDDGDSVVNRTRLLLLTEPTELYNNPDFGSGLKRHLWKYNTPNEVAVIKDRITSQLSKYEPFVDPDKTTFADGLKFTEVSTNVPSVVDSNVLKMTIGLYTTFGREVTIDTTDLQSIVDNVLL